MINWRSHGSLQSLRSGNWRPLDTSRLCRGCCVPIIADLWYLRILPRFKTILVTPVSVFFFNKISKFYRFITEWPTVESDSPSSSLRMDSEEAKLCMMMIPCKHTMVNVVKVKDTQDTRESSLGRTLTERNIQLVSVASDPLPCAFHQSSLVLSIWYIILTISSYRFAIRTRSSCIKLGNLRYSSPSEPLVHLQLTIVLLAK